MVAMLCCILWVWYCLSVLVYAGLSLFIISGPYLYLVVCVLYAYNLAPGQEVGALYQLENDYFAIGKHGMYITLPTEQSVRTCLQTGLAICILERALYPIKHKCMHCLWMMRNI